MSLHGKCIESSDKLPFRNEFVDAETFRERSKDIQERKPLRFLSMIVHETSVQVIDFKPWRYRLFNIGVLDDGRKAIVMYEDMPVYFEVIVPNDKDPNKIAKELFEGIKEMGYNPESYKVVIGKPFIGYQKDDSKFVQLFFTKLKDRVEAINYVRTKGWKTYSDDQGSYYRLLSRTNSIPFVGWLTITDYRITHVKNIDGDIILVKTKNVQPYQGDVMEDKLLSKFPFVVMAWDIETYSPEIGMLPQPDRKDDRVFSISMVFYFGVSKEPFLKICLLDIPSTPNNDYLTIHCDDEKALIKTFVTIIGNMRPEFIIGFNDSDYDWNWVVQRASKHKDLLVYWNKVANPFKSFKEPTDKEVLRNNFRAFSVKLEAGKDTKGRTLTFPSYQTIDVRTSMRKLRPTDELTSLNHFLEVYKLASKLDMPPKELNLRYDRSYKALLNNYDGMDEKQIQTLKKEIEEIALYCVADSKRCQELMCKTSTWFEYMEIARASYCSFNDAVTKAGGVKMRNLVIQVGHKRGYKFSNISNGRMGSKNKYEGAYVIPPEKGLKISKASLSEMNAFKDDKYNEKRRCEEFISKRGIFWKDDMKDDIKTYPEYLKTFLQTKNYYPITAFDFSSLYPSLIMRGNYSHECMSFKEDELAKEDRYAVEFKYGDQTIKAWMKHHHNSVDEHHFGIYPTILLDLFNKRKALKKQKALLEEKMKHSSSEKERDDLEFKINFVDSKQKTAKIFMNTFYGETGNPASPMYALAIAGGVTSDGRTMLRAVEKYLTEKGCVIHYGDTDSIYMSLSGDVYDSVDRKYYSGGMSKIQYWTEIVNLSFKFNNIYGNDINGWIEKTFNTPFLKMAYEEILFPAVLLSKKKYYGYAHEDAATFTKPKLFIRGLDIKKRGTSPMLKKVSQEVINESLDVKNTKDLMTVVLDKVKSIYERKWKLEDFIQTAEYRPPTKGHLGNAKIITFVERMKKENVSVPIGDRFGYVLVKKYPYKYDATGKKSKIGVGDKIEFASVCQEKKLDIDIDAYMTGGIIGMLARFVVYDKRFYDASDKKMQSKAKKFMTEQCQQYFTPYEDDGRVHKTIYKKIAPLLGLDVNLTKKDVSTKLDKMAEARAKQIIPEKYGEEYVKKQLALVENKELKLKELTELYHHSKRGGATCDLFDEQKCELEKKKRKIINELDRYACGDLERVHKIYEEMLIGVTLQIKEKMKDKRDLDDLDDETTKSVMEKIGTINDEMKKNCADTINYFFIGLVEAYISFYRYQRVRDYLRYKHSRDTHQTPTPDPDERKKIMMRAIKMAINM